MRIHGFGAGAEERGAPPTDTEIRAAIQRVGYEKLELLTGRGLKKKIQDLELDLNAIAKGSGVDRIASLLERELKLKSFMVEIGGEGIMLGDNLLLKLSSALIFPGLGPEQDIMLHPVAFAGWIGMLVTMLNLLPLAQLDGGHIAYALLGDRQHWLGRIVMALLIPMGLFLSLNWLLWAVLILVLMRTVRHPPIHDIQRPLSPYELRIGLICLAIFILCFIPIPFA
ncbi:MAG: FAD:protein FMN transferase [Candidatus Marinimicrobia bacterium]|nr:FAD:protein FMN transferase [Candidatus Neomarinimicrobiota bacterium]